MAITLTTNAVSGAGFVANGNSADWSGCETIVAAVTGKSIYIEKIYINSDEDEVITIGAGETAGAVTTPVIGPVHSPGGINIEYVFTRPLKITEATALVADATSSGAATIIVQGFIK